MKNEKLYNKIIKYKTNNEKEEQDKKVILEFMKNNENVLTRDNEIAHFTTSAWIVNRERNKVLMIYHKIYNSWAWVGGHADGIENLMEVAIRETEEETGIKDLKILSNEIFGLNIVTVDNHVKRGKMVNSHLHFDIEYIFEADENCDLRVKEDENCGVKWINFNEIDKYSSEKKMKPIYKYLAEKSKKI